MCDVFSLTTPPIVHFGLACVEFFYYMWGVDVEQLSIATRNLGLDYSWSVPHVCLSVRLSVCLSVTRTGLLVVDGVWSSR